MPGDHIDNNQEIAYTRQLFEKIDRGIQLPDSLSSRALLSRLDEVSQEQRRPFAGMRGMFSLQSGISYAIAFALMIVVFYATQMTGPTVIDSQFIVEPALQVEDAGNEPEGEIPSLVAEQVMIPIQEEEQANDAVEEVPAPFSIEGTGDLSNGNGLGGANPMYLLGEAGRYTLSWRANDPTDPDRVGRITFSVVDREDESVTAEVDIPDMDQIEQFYLEEDSLFLVGSEGQNTVVRCYAGFEDLLFSPRGTLVQPGTLIGTRIYQGYVYIATVDSSWKDHSQESFCEIEELPYSVEEGICYVGALQQETGETQVMGYRNSGSDVALFDHHLYITYSGVSEENEGEHEPYVAQVKLEGLDIQLFQVS